jgi:hypothetical protein
MVAGCLLGGLRDLMVTDRIVANKCRTPDPEKRFHEQS